jgi:hypothetical protein
MDATADLRMALNFVIARIEEEADRSGVPLNDEQRRLLADLPSSSTLPQPYVGDPESPLAIVPRDFAYERLCSLARAAHKSDLRLHSASASDWEFAAAVSKLNGHPLSWLLEWAGVKPHQPKWDRWRSVN